MVYKLTIYNVQLVFLLLFYVARGRGLLVVLGALAVLVVLGGGGAAGVLGDTRQICRGQNRPWDTRRSNAESSTAAGTRRVSAEMHPMTLASSGTPHTKPVAGAHSPSAIARITFGVMDIERRAIPYLSYAYPIMRFQSSSNQVPMRFQWR